MIERYGDTYSLVCDECGMSVDDFMDFNDAVEYKKSSGWKLRKKDGEYSDMCPDCVENAKTDKENNIKTGDNGIIESGSIANVLTERVINEKVSNTVKNVANKAITIFKSQDFRDELASQILKIDNLFFQNMTADEKKEHLLEAIPYAVNDAFMVYFNKRRLETDSTSLKSYLCKSFRIIIDETLQAIADETKRGSLIPCTAVVADAKSEDYTKATVQYPCSYKMTIPSHILIISSDVVQVIQDSIPETDVLDKVEDVEPVKA